VHESILAGSALKRSIVARSAGHTRLPTAGQVRVQTPPFRVELDGRSANRVTIRTGRRRLVSWPGSVGSSWT